MIPRFDSLEEVQQYVDGFKGKKCFPHPFFLCAVCVSEGRLEEARVEKPGWYLARADLRRWLPLDHIIVRHGLDEPQPEPEFPVEACAAPEQ